jgi:hypothetical protein
MAQYNTKLLTDIIMVTKMTSLVARFIKIPPFNYIVLSSRKEVNFEDSLLRGMDGWYKKP